MGVEGKVRLLLVDDEPHFCRVMAMHLADEGYIVATATSGEEALERFGGEEYHLVITDLKMPGVDGLVLLERIRDLSAEVPVIVLTAYGTVDTAVQAMKLGAFDYILKPVDVDELKMVVARALRMQEITKENLALKASLSAFLEPERVEEVLFGDGGLALGRAQLAQGGTLLLDHVDELSPGAQAKLLRFLEEQRVSDRPVVRVMATTVRDLEKLVE